MYILDGNSIEERELAPLKEIVNNTFVRICTPNGETY